MYWKCTVCGYIHTGDAPPEKCPVCGADRSRFIEVDASGVPLSAPAGPSPAPSKIAPRPEKTASADSRKKWKCTVCGYLYTGDAPPEKCPVCGADRSRFIEVDASGAPLSAPAALSPAPAKQALRPQKTASADSRKKWKCSVCGYLHTGDAPPEKCPVCGAGRSMFVELSENAADPSTAAPAPKSAAAGPRRYYDMITDLMVRQHAHPISVHIPNGVAPIGVFFLFLAVAFQSPNLEIAATLNMAVVLLAMPFVLFSGVNDWKKRFGGNMTNIFLTKMICGGLISALLLVLVLWRVTDPAVAATPGGARALYLVLHGIVVGAAALAGYMGGKLVFPNR